MTERDEKNRTVVHIRAAKISKSRIELLASIRNLSIGQIFDMMVENEYNNAVASGETREYLKTLASLDDGIVS